jgi:hypothetical protein
MFAAGLLGRLFAGDKRSIAGDTAPFPAQSPCCRGRPPKNAALMPPADRRKWEGRVSASTTITFPNWLLPAVVHAAEQLHSAVGSEENPAEALELWSRLVFDPRMKRVWSELYKKKRIHHKGTDEFFYPACLTNASGAARQRRRALEFREKGDPKSVSEADLLEAEAALLESLYDPPSDPRWSEQDRAVQLFLRRVYKAALNHELIFLSDLEAKVSKLQKVAKRQRSDAAILKSLGLKREARKLRQIASDLDKDAFSTLPYGGANNYSLETDDPWIITRQRGDLELRTFVANLSTVTGTLFKQTLYGTLATVANVRFNREDVTHRKVREMLRVK